MEAAFLTLKGGTACFGSCFLRTLGRHSMFWQLFFEHFRAAQPVLGAAFLSSLERYNLLWELLFLQLWGGTAPSEQPKSASKRLPATIWLKKAVSLCFHKRKSIAGPVPSKMPNLNTKTLPARIWLKKSSTACFGSYFLSTLGRHSLFWQLFFEHFRAAQPVLEAAF